MNTELRDSPIFICGHPKAGTSLLRAVFDSHPQLIVYPEETVFFRRFLPRALRTDALHWPDLADETLIHIFQWNRSTPPAHQAGYPDRDYSSISFDAVRAEMRRLIIERCRHPGDVLSAAMLAYGQVCGQLGTQTHAWVEKSPYNEFYAGQIFEWWPQARCVHILRDPRDNFLSYKRKHPDWSAEFFAANWRRSTRAGQEDRERFGDGRYLILTYEDLTSAPELSLHRLTGFLDIDWNDSLTAPTRAGEGWQGNSMFADRFQAISAAPVARWKEKLPQSDAAVIEVMAGALMDRFGYERSAANGPAAWVAQARALAWPLRRRLARLRKPAPALDHPDDRTDD